METIPIAFITNDIEISEASFIINKIKEYNPLRYLIAFENPLGGHGYPHYHYLVWWTRNNYNAFIKCIRQKYKLRGKAEKGKRKQYGTIRNIEDIEKLQTYMMKDQALEGKTWWSLNIDNSLIEKYIQASFKKDQASETCFKCIEYVKENWCKKNEYKTLSKVKNYENGTCWESEEISYEKQAKLLMIEFHLEKDLRINKTTINNYYIEYLRTNYKDELTTITDTTLNIYNKIYNN